MASQSPGLLSRIASGFRLDAWGNLLAGLGFKSRDKAANRGVVVKAHPNAATLLALFRQDGRARRLVLQIPADAVRAGFDLNIEVGDEGAVDTDKANDLASDVFDELDRLKALAKLRWAWQLARLFGGALVVIGADDGQDEDQPLDESRLRSIRWLWVLHRHEIDQVGPLVTDTKSEHFGTPEWYEATLGSQTQLGSTERLRIHGSRVIRFDGEQRPANLTTYGDDAAIEDWGDSSLFAVYDDLGGYGQAVLATNHALVEFNQDVYGIENLHAIISQNKEDVLLRRFQLMDMQRSVSKPVLIDANKEKFTRSTTQLGGLAAVLDRVSAILAGGAGWPMTKLFGVPTPGFSDGEGDRKNWQDLVGLGQVDILKPALHRLLGLIFAQREGPSKGREPRRWGLTFRPLEQEPESERIGTRKAQAEIDSAYIDRGVLDAQEVRANRFTAEGYSFETSIDVEAEPSAEASAEAEAIQGEIEE